MSEKSIIDYKEQLDKAWEYFQNSNLEKAEELCNVLINKLPDSLGAYYLLGHIYLQREMYVKSLEKFLVAIEKDNDAKAGGHICYWIGRIYNEYSFLNDKNPIYDREKAKLYYNKAKEYEDYPLDVINKLHYEYRSDYDRIKLYEEAIKKFPDEISFYIHLAQGLESINNREKGIKVLNEAFEKGLKSSSLFYNIGDLYFNNQQFAQSRKFYIDSINLNKQDSNSNYAINYAIANTYYKEGDFINAESYYRKSFDEAKNNDTCWFGFYGLIIIYNEQNRLQNIQELISVCL